MALTLSELTKVSTGIGPKKDKSNVKIAGLTFLGVFFAALFGYSLRLFLTHQDFILFGMTIGNKAIIAAFFFFLIIFFFQVIFIGSFWKAFAIVLLEWFVLISAFLWAGAGFREILVATDLKFLIGAGMVFLFMLLAVKKGNNALKEFVKINFWKISKITLPTAIAAIFLFISVAYVYGTDKKEFVIPYDDFKILFSSNEFLINKVYPEFKFSWTINELASYLAEEQIKKAPQFDILSGAAKKQLVGAAAKEFEKKISDFAGASVNVKLSITEAVYEILKNKLSDMTANAQILISISVLILIFLFLESVAVPVRWLIAFASFIIYEILLAADFAQIELEGISKENIVLK